MCFAVVIVVVVVAACDDVAVMEVKMIIFRLCFFLCFFH